MIYFLGKIDMPQKNILKKSIELIKRLKHDSCKYANTNHIAWASLQRHASSGIYTQHALFRTYRGDQAPQGGDISYSTLRLFPELGMLTQEEGVSFLVFFSC